MRYFIKLSYDGSAFSGWQIQENAISVQSVLQNALSILLKNNISIIGAGRTDTSVNAKNYVAHFDTDKMLFSSNDLNLKIPNKNVEHFIYKINAILPKEIVVHSIFCVPDNIHARFSALSRTYKYYLHTEKDPFVSKYSLFWPFRELDFEKMNKAAEYFIGEHDFSSLEKINGGNKTSICNVTKAIWEPTDCNSFKNSTHFVFTVTANRFLRNMVRAMVGSLLEVGSGKKPVEWISQMMAEHNRSAAGGSVPGNALFLTEIEYDL